MAGLRRQGGVLGHDVVLHEGAAAEEREAARTAEDAADHVLGGLLQPMADGVLESLVPRHQTWRFDNVNVRSFFPILATCKLTQTVPIGMPNEKAIPFS